MDSIEVPASLVIDDLSRPFPESANGSNWRLFTDQVMGGVSRGRLRKDHILGRQGDLTGSFCTKRFDRN